MTRPEPVEPVETFWCVACCAWYWGREHSVEECVRLVDERARLVFELLRRDDPRVLRDRHRAVAEETDPRLRVKTGRRRLVVAA